MKYIWQLLTALMMLILGGGGPLIKAQVTDVHRVKAAFIYQFTKYIEWPDQYSVGVEQEAFLIEVVGDSPIFESLQELAKVKRVKDDPIKVVFVENISDLEPANFVIVNSSDESVLRRIREKLSGTGSVIISHADGFASKGAMINFFSEEGRLRFEINRGLVSEANLKFSSQLLKLARLVE